MQNWAYEFPEGVREQEGALGDTNRQETGGPRGLLLGFLLCHLSPSPSPSPTPAKKAFWLRLQENSLFQTGFIRYILG